MKKGKEKVQVAPIEVYFIQELNGKVTHNIPKEYLTDAPSINKIPTRLGEFYMVNEVKVNNLHRIVLSNNHQVDLKYLFTNNGRTDDLFIVSKFLPEYGGYIGGYYVLEVAPHHKVTYGYGEATSGTLPEAGDIISFNKVKYRVINGVD